MPFDRNADGTIYQRPFGGHSANFGEKPSQRACAAADRTGHAMLHYAVPAQRARAHAVLRRWMALDLCATPTATCSASPRSRWRPASHGSCRPRPRSSPPGARAHLRRSTNAFINTGDGLGMAARAGIPLEDMEFWQFHPTGVAGAGVLITEGVRGEGGILLNATASASWSATRRTSRTSRRATSCRARWTRRSRKAAAAGPTRTTCC
jgi:succinate dehydrogenase / fumarate reductase flavoprotein subunit